MLLIHKKNVANYALLWCKPFSLKIWLCNVLDKYHVWAVSPQFEFVCTHEVPRTVGSVTANTAASTLGEPTQTHHNINVIIIGFIEKVYERKSILSEQQRHVKNIVQCSKIFESRPLHIQPCIPLPSLFYGYEEKTWLSQQI